MVELQKGLQTYKAKEKNREMKRNSRLADHYFDQKIRIQPFRGQFLDIFGRQLSNCLNQLIEVCKGTSFYQQIFQCVSPIEWTIQ